jgi:hypothetical protein
VSRPVRLSIYVLRVLPYPWNVVVLGLMAGAVTLWWWRSVRGASALPGVRALRGAPYGRVIPLTPGEWPAPTVHPGEQTSGGTDA